MKKMKLVNGKWYLRVWSNNVLRKMDFCQRPLMTSLPPANNNSTIVGYLDKRKDGAYFGWQRRSIRRSHEKFQTPPSSSKGWVECRKYWHCSTQPPHEEARKGSVIINLSCLVPLILLSITTSPASSSIYERRSGPARSFDSVCTICLYVWRPKRGHRSPRRTDRWRQTRRRPCTDARTPGTMKTCTE